MEPQFIQYVNYFKEQLKESKMCGEKIVALCNETKPIISAFEKKINSADNITAKLLGDFRLSINTMNDKNIIEECLKGELAKNDCSLFSINALDGSDKSEKGILKTNTSKLNLLLEASLHLRRIVNARAKKVLEKFNEEDPDEIVKVQKIINIVADGINSEVTKINAEIGFLLFKENEISLRIQTYDALTNELKKRFIAAI